MLRRSKTSLSISRREKSTRSVEENGAGKSTLIKLLGGIHPAGSYEGELEVGGAPARFQCVADASRAGLAVICQELALVEAMSRCGEYLPWL